MKVISAMYNWVSQAVGPSQTKRLSQATGLSKADIEKTIGIIRRHPHIAEMLGIELRTISDPTAKEIIAMVLKAIEKNPLALKEAFDTIPPPRMRGSFTDSVILAGDLRGDSEVAQRWNRTFDT